LQLLLPVRCVQRDEAASFFDQAREHV
jgi:hypothetical protein